MAARKVFISSVRRGLEEERDSLPALVKAVGHLPRRFEDFTAQPQPSRDAFLAGVEGADVYLLLLGPHYGDPIFDSGLSPTEEEWTVGKRRGIPILVFRKLDVDLDDAQLAFAKRVEDYVTGRFRDTFSTTADLSEGRREASRTRSGDWAARLGPARACGKPRVDHHRGATSIHRGRSDGRASRSASWCDWSGLGH